MMEIIYFRGALNYAKEDVKDRLEYWNEISDKLEQL